MGLPCYRDPECTEGHEGMVFYSNQWNSTGPQPPRVTGAERKRRLENTYFSVDARFRRKQQRVLARARKRTEIIEQQIQEMYS